MPHKRAKRSVRNQQRSQQGTDLPPTGTISTEALPKSLTRVLNAHTVREQWHQKKRKLADGDGVSSEGGRRRKRMKGDDTSGHGTSKSMSIEGGETIKHFNRRVDDETRPLILSAMKLSPAKRRPRRAHSLPKPQTSGSSALNKNTSATATGGDPKTAHVRDPDECPKEFEKISTSVPRRLNDVVRAPPDFKKLPRGATRGQEQAFKSGKDGILSMAQKVMMEEERAKAIARYRTMKKR